MIRKGTWVVLAVFVVLLLAVFYLNSNPLPSLTPTPTAVALPTEAGPLLASWPEADIVSIELRDGASTSVSLTQNFDGSWAVGPENSRPAALGQVENLRTQIGTMRVMTILDPGSSVNLEVLGLSTPKNSLVLKNKQGQQVTIYIGNTTPTGSGYYVKVNQDAPVIVSKYVVDGILDLLKRDQLIALTPTPDALVTPDIQVTPGATATQ